MAEPYKGQSREQQRAAAEKAGQEAKERYTKEARRLYRNMTAEQAVKELKKLERGPGILGWLRGRWDGFWNLVKTAMYSILLGRQAAERRILSGNQEEALRLQREEAKKEARISVLEEKVREMGAKETGEKEQAGPESEKTEQTAEAGQESGKSHQETGQVETDTPISVDSDRTGEAGPETENEQPNKRKPGDFSRLGIQCEQVTEYYQKGLAGFLEEQMGIGEGNIRVANGSKNSIQISLWPSGEEQPRFCMGINPNGSVYYPSGSMGEDGVSRAFQGALLKSALYYTAKVYDCAKDQELSRYGFEPDRVSIKPGTVPSVEMIERLLDKETAYLFGHKIECRKGKEGAIIRLDGKRISLKDGQSAGETVRTAMKEKIFGDYERIHELSKRMKLFVAKEQSPFHDLAESKHYSCKEIAGMAEKLIHDRTSDGSPDMVRTDSLYGHLITLQLEPVSSKPGHKDYRRVMSVRIDNTAIYQAARLDKGEDIQELKATLQKENQMAGAALWNSLCMALEAEKKLEISGEAKHIHEALSGRITDLDPESGQRMDIIASCIREGDTQTVRELLFLGHQEDIQKAQSHIGPELVTAEMACLLEQYGMADSREDSQEEKEETDSLEQGTRDFMEQDLEGEK